jgi:hypothetical protein
MIIPRDAPNAWPPHQYIILKGLQALPPHVSKGHLPQPSGSASTYSLIPNTNSACPSPSCHLSPSPRLLTPRQLVRLLTYRRAMALSRMEAMRLVARDGAGLCRESWRIGISQAHYAVGGFLYNFCWKVPYG